ncbi:hypothetical protein PG984_005363 [Apiospora sp. TS-2023a]
MDEGILGPRGKAVEDSSERSQFLRLVWWLRSVEGTVGHNTWKAQYEYPGKGLRELTLARDQIIAKATLMMNHWAVGTIRIPVRSAREACSLTRHQDSLSVALKSGQEDGKQTPAAFLTGGADGSDSPVLHCHHDTSDVLASCQWQLANSEYPVIKGNCSDHLTSYDEPTALDYWISYAIGDRAADPNSDETTSVQAKTRSKVEDNITITVNDTPSANVNDRVESSDTATTSDADLDGSNEDDQVDNPTADYNVADHTSDNAGAWPCFSYMARAPQCQDDQSDYNRALRFVHSLLGPDEHVLGHGPPTASLRSEREPTTVSHHDQ